MLTVATQDQALKHYFEHHFNRLGVGMIMTITGNQRLKFGVGKSYSAMRIAEILDEDFRDGTKGLVKIVHTPTDFLRAMEAIEKKGTRGQVLIIDEAGLLVSSRQWFSMINKAMSDVVMTFRVLKCLAIFITPSLWVIDKNVRMFTNLWGVSEKVIQDGYPKVRVRLYRMEWDNYEPNKPWRKNIAMYVKEHKKVTYFKNFWVDMPHNKELIEAYEEKAAQYKRQVRQQIQELEDRTVDEYAAEAANTGDLIHIKAGKPKVYFEEIKDHFGLTKDKAWTVARKTQAALLKRHNAGENFTENE